ncbi:MAG TPA: hypothetical protein VHJ17_05120 [Thermomonospora sp.]|nr:hypothetical protein [Thermomonospora sp.]
MLASTGAKITMAALGTAAAVTAGTVGVTALTSDDTPRARPAQSTPAGQRIDFGAFSLTAPAGATWRVQPIQPFPNRPADSFRVDVPGRCTGDNSKIPREEFRYRQTTYCPSFLVLGPTLVDPENGPGGVRLPGPYHPAGDITHVCPPAAERYNTGTWEGRPKAQLVAWGNRRAEYREWRMRCTDLRGSQVVNTNLTFTQRLWFLPQSRIAIVDEWNVPDLPRIIAQAVWG